MLLFLQFLNNSWILTLVPFLSPTPTTSHPHQQTRKPNHSKQQCLLNFSPYQLQGQGHSWLSEPVLYPGDEQPSLDHFGMFLWDPGESSEIFGNQSH